MHSLKFGLLLAVTGIFSPLVCLPLAEGYRRNAGVVTNMQSMYVPITGDKREPDFRVVDGLGNEPNIISVEWETNTVLGFPATISDAEIKTAIMADRRLQNEPRPKFMRFYGWRVASRGAFVPLRYILSGCVLLVLLGVGMIVYHAKRTEQKSNAA